MAETDDEAESGSRAVDRLTFFSDAVVAIAITLLAIDLPVPDGSTLSSFWASVQQDSGHYAAFIISFLAIAAAWSQHHDIFRHVVRMDARLRTLNTFWLLMIILTPFATKLLTSHGHQYMETRAVRFGFYALLQALESATVIALLRHIVSRDQAPKWSRASATGVALRSSGLVIGFAVSIPLFFATKLAWVAWFAGPAVADHLYRRHRRHRSKKPPSEAVDPEPALEGSTQGRSRPGQQDPGEHRADEVEDGSPGSAAASQGE